MRLLPLKRLSVLMLLTFCMYSHAFAAQTPPQAATTPQAGVGPQKQNPLSRAKSYLKETFRTKSPEERIAAAKQKLTKADQLYNSADADAKALDSKPGFVRKDRASRGEMLKQDRLIALKGAIMDLYDVYVKEIKKLSSPADKTKLTTEFEAFKKSANENANKVYQQAIKWHERQLGIKPAA